MRKKPDDLVVLRAVSMAIQQHMDKTGLNQQQLAERIDVTQGTVSRWFGGQSIPRGDALLRLARELQVKPESLVGQQHVADGPDTLPVLVVHRIGCGPASGAMLRLPASAFIGATTARLVGIEIADDSANARFPPGTVLACESWEGEPFHRALAVVVPHPMAGAEGPFRLAAASAPGPTGAVRWWSLATGPGRDGPLPTADGEVWTPAFRPVVAVMPVSPMD